MAATVDLFVTFAAVAGAALSSGVVLDGVDMSPILFQNKPVSALTKVHTLFPSLLSSHQCLFHTCMFIW